MQVPGAQYHLQSNPTVLLKLTPVDVAFAAENAGLAAAVAAFYQAKNYANSAAVGLWDATYADVLALGSLLAMARCGGPQVILPTKPI